MLVWWLLLLHVKQTCWLDHWVALAIFLSPLRVEITLASNDLSTAMCHKALDGTTPMQITNCEYIAQFIELNDTAMSIISNSQQGQPIQFVFQDYINYQYSSTLPTSITTITMPIPAKFAA